MQGNLSVVTCLRVLCGVLMVLMGVSTNAQHLQQGINYSLIANHAISVPSRSDSSEGIVFVHDKKLKGYITKVSTKVTTITTTAAPTTKRKVQKKKTTTVRPPSTTMSPRSTTMSPPSTTMSPRSTTMSPPSTTMSPPCPTKVTSTTSSRPPNSDRTIITVPTLRQECEDAGKLFDDNGECREIWRNHLPPVDGTQDGGENKCNTDNLDYETTNIPGNRFQVPVNHNITGQENNAENTGNPGNKNTSNEENDGRPGHHTSGGNDGRPGHHTSRANDGRPEHHTSGGNDGRPEHHTSGGNDGRSEHHTSGENDGRPGHHTSGGNDGRPGHHTSGGNDGRPDHHISGGNDGRPGHDTSGGNDERPGHHTSGGNTGRPDHQYTHIEEINEGSEHDINEEYAIRREQNNNGRNFERPGIHVSGVYYEEPGTSNVGLGNGSEPSGRNSGRRDQEAIGGTKRTPNPRPITRRPSQEHTTEINQGRDCPHGQVIDSYGHCQHQYHH